MKHTISSLLFYSCVYTCLVLGITPPVKAVSSFAVAPGVLEFDLSNPKTGSFVIRNNGDESIRLMIQPVYFAVDSKSLKAGIALHPQTKFQEDISSLVAVSPRILVLKPSQRRTIRVSVRQPDPLFEGDYRAHLLIRTLKRKHSGRRRRNRDDAKGTTIHLNIKMETAVAVYGRYGKPKTELQWECQRDKEGRLQLIAINESKWLYKGWVGTFKYSDLTSSSHLETQRLFSSRESSRRLKFNHSTQETIHIRWKQTEESSWSGYRRCRLNAL